MECGVENYLTCGMWSEDYILCGINVQDHANLFYRFGEYSSCPSYGGRIKDEDYYSYDNFIIES